MAQNLHQEVPTSIITIVFQHHDYKPDHKMKPKYLFLKRSFSIQLLLQDKHLAAEVHFSFKSIVFEVFLISINSCA